MNLSPEVLRHSKDLVAIRRAIHQYPEPGFQEHRTAALIRSELKRCGVETRRLSGTGTVGLVKGVKPGPTILIRADMDALPVLEENRVPYVSKNRGMMHACGHDGHVAMALIAARLLQARRASLRGNVKFMFQPAEEGPGGAGPMIEEGLLERPRVDAAFAIHLWNDLPVGRAGVRTGAVFASADEFVMTVVGKGGHGAAPHQTVDPVAVAAQVVVACQNIVSRRVDPTKAAVVTFAEIRGGTRHNIIPDQVELTGTLRAFDGRVRRQIRTELPRIAGRVAAAFGARLRFEFTQAYPPTVNDAKMVDLVREAALGALGKSGPTEQDPSMGAEDMSLVLEKVPGCYFFVGSSNARKGLAFPHHNARFDFDERALAGGVEIWLRLAERFLDGRPR